MSWLQEQSLGCFSRLVDHNMQDDLIAIDLAGLGHPAQTLIMTSNAKEPERGFVESLFDFSFTSLAFSRLIKALYVLVMIWIGLNAIVWFPALAVIDNYGPLLALVVVPLVSLVILAFCRLLLESMIIVYRIHENVARLVARLDAATKGVGDDRTTQAGTATEAGPS